MILVILSLLTKWNFGLGLLSLAQDCKCLSNYIFESGMLSLAQVRRCLSWAFSKKKFSRAKPKEANLFRTSRILSLDVNHDTALPFTKAIHYSLHY